MSAPGDARSPWAPWWAYLVPILGLNYLRQALVSPGDLGDAANVAMFAAVTVAVAALVTLVHRRLQTDR
jgi:hypothetical protein